MMEKGKYGKPPSISSFDFLFAYLFILLIRNRNPGSTKIYF